MFNLAWHELIVGSIGLICGCIIAKEFALNGILELCLQRPINKKAFGALLSVAIILVIYSLINVATGFVPNQIFLNMCLFCIPVCWGLFSYIDVMPFGIVEFNMARHRTFHWATNYYVPGQRSIEKEKVLNGSCLAQDTIKLYEKAIKKFEDGIPRVNLEIVATYE